MRRLLIAAALLAASSAIGIAGTVDFTAELKNIDGSDFVDSSGKSAPLTLEKIAENSLLASYPDEQNITGEEKIKRYGLALKIHDHAKSLDLDADQTALLKKLIAKAYNPLVTGQSWRILDPASIPK